MMRVFCDFDGTVAEEDVGNRLFSTFGGTAAEDAVRRLLSGMITAQECLRLECSLIRNLSAGEFAAWVDGFRLDPEFSAFVRFCEELQVPIHILSDGLDLYVGRMLKNEGLERIPFFANHGEFVSQNGRVTLVPTFPYRDAECDQCGNCKRNHLATLSGDEDVVVYVGDGISDRCAVGYADIVFARDDLIPYCQSKNITYHTFRHFGDVRERLKSLRAQGK
ncbi:MAG: MtnX-like HAD-IB family phosphatase, partial [Bacteroidota bacterium]